MDYLNDEEMDAIWDQAREAAIHEDTNNPYPPNSLKAEFYSFSLFVWLYAKENEK